MEAVAFSTGMAASLAVFQALAPGDHVALHRDLYFGVRELITGLFARWGLEHSFVDMRDIEELRQACRPQTKLLRAQTPTNPLIEVVEIRPVAECARSLQIPLACENTFATPVLQRPLELGADLGGACPDQIPVRAQRRAGRRCDFRAQVRFDRPN